MSVMMLPPANGTSAPFHKPSALFLNWQSANPTASRGKSALTSDPTPTAQV
jgi:hypothetical protein